MRLRRWLPALVLGCVLASFLNGLVVGYGVLWFQLFGAQPDREDYLVSFGGYAAASLVVLVGLLALIRLGTASTLVVLTAVIGVLLGLLALSSLATGMDRAYDFRPTSQWWDGAGGVMFMPWAWPPLALGLLAACGVGPRRPEPAG